MGLLHLELEGVGPEFGGCDEQGLQQDGGESLQRSAGGGEEDGV